MNQYRVSLRTEYHGYTMLVTAPSSEAAEITALASLDLDYSDVVEIATDIR